MIIVDTISLADLEKMASRMYDNLVKAVVDVERRLLVVDAELHSDQEALLLQDGSEQQNVWGINLYPAEYGTEFFIEFDSMINIRPRQQNRSRDVEDASIRQKITEIVHSKITS